MKRRSVLKSMAALAAASPLMANTTHASIREFPSDLTILFQGDSITDAGRDKSAYYANNASGMGNGYVKHIVTELIGEHPVKNLRFYNRGISGNKVYQLRDRWTEDCIQLGPDVLSIMIGVNDFWHTLDFGYNGTAKTYENDFRELLAATKLALPRVKLLIGEPFVLLDGSAIKADKWRGQFEAYQAASRQIAVDFGAVFIPYQSVFDKALLTAPASYWCPDGVHPSMAGNYLMAKAWQEGFTQLKFF